MRISKNHSPQSLTTNVCYYRNLVWFMFWKWVTMESQHIEFSVFLCVEILVSEWQRHYHIFCTKKWCQANRCEVQRRSPYLLQTNMHQSAFCKWISTAENNGLFNFMQTIENWKVLNLWSNSNRLIVGFWFIEIDAVDGICHLEFVNCVVGLYMWFVFCLRLCVFCQWSKIRVEPLICKKHTHASSQPVWWPPRSDSNFFSIVFHC